MRNSSLTDIAKKLGVSKTLVSLVMNGRGKENRISDDMIKKVHAVAKELNYKPNYLAKGLRTGKTNTIGIVVSDISNPVFAMLGRYMEDEAAKQGYSVFFTSSDEKSERTTKLINILLDRQVDGLILVPAENNKEDIQNLIKQKTPLVLIDRYYPRLKSNFVVVDNYRGAYDAVNHLKGIGYDKIGFISFDWKLSNYKMRLEGYKSALKDNKIRINNAWIKYINFNRIKTEVRHAIREMVVGPNAVRAILLANNTIAYHVLQLLQEMKLRVPQDIAIVSFDSDPAFAFTSSPLTVIDQPFAEIAKHAVSVLVDDINGKLNDKQQITLKAQLKVRQSCGANI